ncbi:hypothetical protein ABT097_28300 [Streptomyces sp. NPDC002225]|uniref:hypothetical protein n=1 Tax=Streptomyces sp. NPDC002225 TaxID=3154413 RepID=UPI00331D938D
MSRDAVQAVGGLWRRLVEHQPALAAALARRLRDMPEDWSMRHLGAARPEAVLHIPRRSAARGQEVRGVTRPDS